MIVVIVVVAAGAGLVSYWTRPQPVRVAVVAAELGDVSATVANTRAGAVDACQRAGLSPAIGGQVATLLVSEGDRIETGQVLLELWNEDRRAEVVLAERDAVAVKGLAREVCVVADVADREATRLVSLRERGLSSEEETDRAVGDAEARKAGCAAAQDAARVSDARIEVAEAALRRTVLTAPFDGVIAEINAELGEYVTPSPVGVATPPTVDLIDESCLYISAPIDEIDAPHVQAGMSVLITMDAFPDRKFPGHVRRVAPYVLEVEKQARTVEIEAVIDNPAQNALLPGYSADVEVILATRSNVLRVPTQAIINGQRLFLFDEQDRVIEERTVETGVSNWEYTEITAGLEAGELVVLTVDREGVVDGASAIRE